MSSRIYVECLFLITLITWIQACGSNPTVSNTSQLQPVSNTSQPTPDVSNTHQRGCTGTWDEIKKCAQGYPTFSEEERIINTQEMLRSVGYYPGLRNGVMQPQTRKAIEDYQRDNGMEVTGIISQDFFVALDDHIKESLAIENRENSEHQRILDERARKAQQTQGRARTAIRPPIPTNELGKCATTGITIETQNEVDFGDIVPISVTTTSTNPGSLWIVTDNSLVPVVLIDYHTAQQEAFLKTRLKLAADGNIIAVFKESSGDCRTAKKFIRVPKNVAATLDRTTVGSIKGGNSPVRAKVERHNNEKNCRLKLLIESPSSSKGYIKVIKVEGGGENIATIYGTEYLSRKPFFSLNCPGSISEIIYTIQGNDGAEYKVALKEKGSPRVLASKGISSEPLRIPNTAPSTPHAGKTISSSEAENAEYRRKYAELESGNSGNSFTQLSERLLQQAQQANAISAQQQEQRRFHEQRRLIEQQQQQIEQARARERQHQEALAYEIRERERVKQQRSNQQSRISYSNPGTRHNQNQSSNYGQQRESQGGQDESRAKRHAASQIRRGLKWEKNHQYNDVINYYIELYNPTSYVISCTSSMNATRTDYSIAGTGAIGGYARGEKISDQRTVALYPGKTMKGARLNNPNDKPSWQVTCKPN